MCIFSSGPQNIFPRPQPKFSGIKQYGSRNSKHKCICNKNFDIGYIQEFYAAYPDLKNMCDLCNYLVPRSSATEKLLVCINPVMHKHPVIIEWTCWNQNSDKHEAILDPKVQKHKNECKKTLKKHIANGPQQMFDEFQDELNVCFFFLVFCF